MGARRPTSVDLMVGRKLRQLRQSKHLSLSDLAGHAGVSWQQLQKYETGHNRIAVGTLWDLAKGLNEPLETFFEDTRGAGPGWRR